MATRCCSPPESCAGRCVRRSPSPTRRKRFGGLRFVGDAVKILRQHHVFDGGEIRHEMELLKDEADFFGAIANELIFVEFGEIGAIDDDAAGGQRVETAENIDERGFAGAGRAHQRDPFAGADVEGKRIDGAQCAVRFRERLDGDLGGLRLLEASRLTSKYRRGTNTGKPAQGIRASNGNDDRQGD